MRAALTWLGGAVVMTALAATGPAQAVTGAGGGASVDLSGRWRLDKAASDDEQAKEDANAEAQVERDAPAPRKTDRAQDGGSGRRGERRGRGAGAVEGAPAGNGEDDDPRGVQRTAPPAELLTIAQNGKEVAVIGPPGPQRLFFPDGRSYKTDDGAAEVKCTWKDGALVIEKKSLHGWRSTESWHLTPDRRRLVVNVRVEGGSRPRLSFRRVYDRETAER